MGIAGGIATDTAGGGTATTDATAEQWHIKSGKTAYIASGKVTGNAYTPAMLDFDGSSGYFSGSITTSGNLITVRDRFKVASFSGGGVQYIARCQTSSARFGIYLVSNDHATPAIRSKLGLFVNNSGGSNICALLSTVTVTDDSIHDLHFAYSGTAGTAVLRIDSADVDDTGWGSRVLTTGTVDSGAATFYVGRTNGASSYLNGEMGYFGYGEVYLSDYTDLANSDGTPKALDESTWSEWTSQPVVWNPHCDLRDNRGSGANFTQNGTIIVGDGGAA